MSKKDWVDLVAIVFVGIIAFGFMTGHLIWR